MKKHIGLLIGAVMMISTWAHAEALGVVDMQAVFMSYKKTEVARKDFEKKQAELQKEMDKKQKELEKAQADNKKPEEIQKLVTSIQEELKPKQEALMELNNQLMGTIRQDILNASQSVAKKYGVDVVVDKQAVLYGGFDLTNFVIDELND